MQNKKYYILFDGKSYGPYCQEEVERLGILEDTYICSDDADQQWKKAIEHPEFAFLFSTVDYANSQGFIPADAQQSFVTDYEANDDDDEADEDDYDDEDDEDDTPSQRMLTEQETEDLFFYKHKRRAALIGVLTLGLAGLAVAGVGTVWRGNLFEGTSLYQGGTGARVVLKLLSFMILSVIIAIPFFIISFFKLIYYSIKISNLS